MLNGFKRTTRYRETTALQKGNVLVASFSLIFFDPMNFHRTALINCLGSSTCTSLHLAVYITTERNARKISEFIDYECDQHDGVEEEYPGTPENPDSADDAQPTPVESPTKRARSTTNVAPECHSGLTLAPRPTCRRRRRSHLHPRVRRPRCRTCISR